MNAVMEFARRRRTMFATIIPLLMWVFSDPTPASLLMGLAFVAVGQAIRIWSAGHIYKNQDVATGGPYAYVRNPLYLGSFIISVGLAVMTNRWWAYLVVAAQFLFFYYLAILSEERYLSSTLGEPYLKYRETVPRFWPTKGRHPEPNGAFAWEQVSYNKEYRSFVPIGLLCILFALRAWKIIPPLLLIAGSLG
jgi:isoprenylcysteine carboxyl methyltransferase (ICMT) family protein YpbQ